MKISTLNINSINARMESFPAWLQSQKPDVVLLQEIKSQSENFPFFELSALGYNAEILGEKSYNGVAVLSPHKIKVVSQNLPNFEDEHARYLEVDIKIEEQNYRVASVYVPNGNPPYNKPDDISRLAYKFDFMEALYKRAEILLAQESNVVIGGDFNVIMSAMDVFDEKAFIGDALYHPEVIRKMRSLLNLGFYDAYRLKYPKDIGYTFWDYTGGSFQQDKGMRIDYLLLSPALADRLQSIEVDKNLRRGIKPSDHTALIAQLR